MKRKDTRLLLPICFATYVCAYLCRVNFSAAAARLAQKLALDYGTLGAAGAAFFAVYAVGQLVNGLIGDRMDPVRFLLTALGGTVLCNLGVGFSTAFWQIFVIWGLNGYFQSIFWSTLIRVLALRGPKDRQASLSSAISASMPVGYFLSWCVLTPLLDAFDPKWSFLVPAVLAAGLIPVWFAGGRNEKNAFPTGRVSLRESGGALLALVREEKMTPLLAATVCLGLIKEGIGFWIPSLIRGLTERPLFVYGMLALLPAANFAGTRLAKAMLKKRTPPVRLAACCFAAMAPLCLLLTAGGPFAAILLMACISCACYCVDTVLMSYLPMCYRDRNMVSSVVGLLDFFSYVGAAVSSYALGSLMDRAGFAPLPWVWLGAAAAAVPLLLLGRRARA